MKANPKSHTHWQVAQCQPHNPNLPISMPFANAKNEPNKRKIKHESTTIYIAHSGVLAYFNV